MQCTCGFNFALHIIEGGKLVSYAVIADARYQEFLRREMRVLKAPRKSARAQRLIGESAELVGSLMVCPECGNYHLNLPEGKGRVALTPSD